MDTEHLSLSGTEESTQNHTSEKPYKCSYCDKAFTRIYKLNQHMAIHTGEMPYKCSKCISSFFKYNDFKLHMKLHTD